MTDIKSPSTRKLMPHSTQKYAALSDKHLEQVSSWGEATSGMSYVYRPSTVEALRDILALAKQSGRTVGLRGGGNSYGDAAMNSENILIDMCRLRRILEWDPATGRIRVEPGVTLAELWQYIIEDGWWPPVATGTSATTMGGSAAMNVHGKNAFKVGPIGDHIIEFDLMLTSGEVITCSREENSDVFHAAIGGFGMLGLFISLTLQMKRIYSGLLDVETSSRRDLGEMFAYFREHAADSDYVVGWIDSLATGKSLGRGDV
ncbi:MAG TPA: FAD-dependent oxidoreductase, partial [Promineifilum sp.]|nr:FAD-dependent oxidoreductase [Promineifilum sp.]